MSAAVSRSLPCQCAGMQAMQLLCAYKKHHVQSDGASRDLLYMLEMMLPDAHHLVPTFYQQRLWARRQLCKQFNGDTMFTRDLCADPSCDYQYLNYPGAASDKCPECSTPRYKCVLPPQLQSADTLPQQHTQGTWCCRAARGGAPLPGGPLQGARKLRYSGLENGVRVLMQRPAWCRAHQRFDVKEAMAATGSIMNSPLMEVFYNTYIPAYDTKSDAEQRAAAELFLRTGQVCSEEEASRRQRTILLLVESGADAFQPYKRREHSTWMHAFR